MKNVAREVLDRIDAMKERKTAELEEIFRKAQEAGETAGKAEQAMKEAAENLDLATYAKAKNEKETADVAAEMYGKRYTQLEQKQYVSEEESDATIDALKRYEDGLADEYEKAIAAPIQKLRELTADYKKAIDETEHAFRVWTQDVHAYYRSEGTSYPDGTNRSKTPVPVHALPYTGCPVSKIVARFLEKVEA